MGARGRSADSDRIDVGREWVAEEMSGCQFPDQRLGSRLHSLMGSLGAQVGSTIPTACEDWASIKAAYRFLSNDRVDEHAGSLAAAGHREAGLVRDALKDRDVSQGSEVWMQGGGGPAAYG